MKKKLLILTLLASSIISIQASTINLNEEMVDETCATCSGEFKINGDSYTITLHDVSWWTCVKFKVGSWFK